MIKLKKNVPNKLNKNKNQIYLINSIFNINKENKATSHNKIQCINHLKNKNKIQEIKSRSHPKSKNKTERKGSNLVTSKKVNKKKSYLDSYLRKFFNKRIQKLKENHSEDIINPNDLLLQTNYSIDLDTNNDSIYLKKVLKTQKKINIKKMQNNKNILYGKKLNKKSFNEKEKKLFYNVTCYKKNNKRLSKNLVNDISLSRSCNNYEKLDKTNNKNNKLGTITKIEIFHMKKNKLLLSQKSFDSSKKQNNKNIHLSEIKKEKNKNTSDYIKMLLKKRSIWLKKKFIHSKSFSIKNKKKEYMKNKKGNSLKYLNHKIMKLSSLSEVRKSRSNTKEKKQEVEKREKFLSDTYKMIDNLKTEENYRNTVKIKSFIVLKNNNYFTENSTEFKKQINKMNIKNDREEIGVNIKYSAFINKKTADNKKDIKKTKSKLNIKRELRKLELIKQVLENNKK